MKSQEYYRRENEAMERVRKALIPRRPPFRVHKTTTENGKRYIVVFELFKRPVVLRIQKGQVTWVASNQSATLFRSRANAKAAIKAYNEKYTHSCRMTKHDIVLVGDAEIYHG